MLRKMYLVSSPDHFHHKKTAKQITTNKLPTTTTSIENKNANNNNNHKNRAPRNKRQKKNKKRRVSKKLHPYDKWLMTRKKIKETGVRREALIKEIANFLERVLPKHTPFQQQQLPVTEKEPITETSVQTSPLPPRRLEEEEEAVAVLPSTSSSPSDDTIVFETPKKKHETIKRN